MASEIRVNQIQSRTGVSTVSFTDTGPVISGVTTVQGTLTVDGSLNVGGDLTIPGVLTYDDVTNVDSIGVITARSGIHVTGGSVGIGTDSPNAVLSVQTSASRQLNVETDSGDGNLVLKCTAPNSSNNLRDIDIAGENVSLSTGAFDTTAHAERLVIDSTGRIGVGTNTFNDAAEVMRVQAAEGQNNTLFTIKANSTSGYCALNFGDDDFNEGRIIYQHSDNTMRFRTDDTERVSIGSSEFYMSGFIRTGNRPFMRANANPDVDTGDDVIVKNFNNVEQNTNFNSYDNSTGIYTCPIDGFYAANAGLWVENVPSLSSHTFAIIEHKRNGSIVTAGAAGANAGQEHATMNISSIFNCLAGDTIHLLTSNFDRKSSTPRNYFNITFIG